MRYGEKHIKGEVVVAVALMVVTLFVMAGLVVAEMQPTGGVYIPSPQTDKCKKEQK